MRRLSNISAAVLTSLLLISCSTEKFRGYNNSYSYKISGNITVEAVNASSDDNVPMEPAVKAAVPENPGLPDVPGTDPEVTPQPEKPVLPGIGPVTLTLRPEEGQLRLIDRGDGNIYLSFNAMAGNVTLTEATIDGMDITLAPDQQKLVKFEAQGILGNPIMVNWDGTGNIFDNAIVFHLHCSGQQTILGKEMTITDSDLKCVAIKNE